MYDEIYRAFKHKTSRPTGAYPVIEGVNVSHLNGLLESCVSFYNHLDSAKTVLEKTLPEIYSELKSIIDDKIIGSVPQTRFLVDITKSTYSDSIGTIKVPSPEKLAKGILNIIGLLKESLYFAQIGSAVRRDERYSTAKYVLYAMKGNLVHFATRFDYVMMYPHRILLDKIILETGLKKHGLDKVLAYVHASEEHYNNQKSIEFCAMARNALEETVNNVSLIIEGFDKGFSENIKKLYEVNFLKGTFLKQIKEFRGSLSAGGSHPPKEEMSINEMKLLLDNLYAFIGFMVINLSKHKV